MENIGKKTIEKEKSSSDSIDEYSSQSESQEEAKVANTLMTIGAKWRTKGGRSWAKKIRKRRL